MKLLLDTHLILWASTRPDRLPDVARNITLLTADPVLGRYPAPVWLV